MPRFNPEKWKPQDESSPGVYHLDPDCVVLLVDQRLSDDSRSIINGCPCGCGDFPASEKTTFCMGHDARLRGKLIRAHLMDVKVRYFYNNEATGLMEPVDAMSVAATHGWQEYLTSAALRRDGKNRELLRKALSHPDLAQAGKWDYTGGQVVVLFKPKKGMQDVMYVDRAGEIRKKRVPVQEAEEIAK